MHFDLEACYYRGMTRNWERTQLQQKRSADEPSCRPHLPNVPIDTHEHLYSEQQFVEEGPDLLQDLFDNYVAADLLVAGARSMRLRYTMRSA